MGSWVSAVLVSNLNDAQGLSSALESLAQLLRQPHRNHRKRLTGLLLN